MDEGDKLVAIIWIAILAVAGYCAYDDETSSSSDNYEYEEVEIEAYRSNCRIFKCRYVAIGQIAG